MAAHVNTPVRLDVFAARHAPDLERTTARLLAPLFADDGEPALLTRDEAETLIRLAYANGLTSGYTAQIFASPAAAALVPGRN